MNSIQELHTLEKALSPTERSSLFPFVSFADLQLFCLDKGSSVCLSPALMSS